MIIRRYPFAAAIAAKPIPVLPDTVTINYCAKSNKGVEGIPVGVEKESLNIRTLNVAKYLGHFVTAMEFDNLKKFGEMFIRQLADSLKKNVFVFDAEKAFKNISEIVSYYDSNLINAYKQLKDFIDKMYEEFEKGGYDSSALSSYGEYVCIISGIDKFKMLLGNEFNTIFGDLLIKIKAMPKMHFIIFDSVDNIKKNEYDPWYKSVMSPSRGIWIGDGITNQFTLKSTLSSRILGVKIDNNFGYYIDGSVTVLIKVVTEVGEPEIETL